MEQELTFKALADESRRKLLDLLFIKDGRSLSELEGHLPMTRFGVMKHLKVLERAGLVATRKNGRETLHYLNAVPIQLVYDRWVSKYAKGWARSLTELKYDLEADEMAEAKAVETKNQIFEVYIRTTPEKLWRALTDGAMTEKYYYGTRVESDWQNGSAYSYRTPDGGNMLDGTVLESDPPRRLVMTFNPHWMPDAGEFPESKVTYEISPAGEACKLTLIHEDLVAGNPMTDGIQRGWSEILSCLKTFLETGEPLNVQSNSADR
ncbi:MAG: SRPBCC domain-containing protein [Pyrinomonadaceae bacterium]